MSQISPPIRILLVAVVGLIAVYMLFLKPKTEEAAPAAAAPVTATPVPAKDPNATTSSKPGSAVNQAVTGADSASARADAAAGGAIAESEGGTAPGVAGATAPGVPVTGSAAAPPVTKEALASLPKDVRGAVRKHQVLVLLFYNNRSDDDKAVRRALDKVDRYGGQAFVDAHWIKSVSRYQAITRGADVEQSPTIVVADRNLKAETLVGYVDDKTIDQAVVDAIRANGGSLIRDRHLRKLDLILRGAEARMKALPAPAADAAVPAHLLAQRDISDDARRSIVSLKPPTKWKRFHQQLRVWSARRSDLIDETIAAVKEQPTNATATLRKAVVKTKARNKRFVAKHGRLGVRPF